MKWTAASKVMRPRNFWVPKRDKTPKGPKPGSIWNFPVLQVEIPQNHGHKPNLKRNRFKFLNLRTDRTIGPKIAPIPKPLFWDGNWKFGRCQSGDILYIARHAKFQVLVTPGPKVIGFRTFGPKKGPVPKNRYPYRKIQISLIPCLSIQILSNSWKIWLILANLQGSYSDASKKRILVCKIDILTPNSTKFLLRTHMPQGLVPAKYGLWTSYGYQNIALWKKKGDSPKLRSGL